MLVLSITYTHTQGAGFLGHNKLHLVFLPPWSTNPHLHVTNSGRSASNGTSVLAAGVLCQAKVSCVATYSLPLLCASCCLLHVIQSLHRGWSELENRFTHFPVNVGASVGGGGAAADAFAAGVAAGAGGAQQTGAAGQGNGNAAGDGGPVDLLPQLISQVGLLLLCYYELAVTRIRPTDRCSACTLTAQEGTHPGKPCCIQICMLTHTHLHLNVHAHTTHTHTHANTSHRRSPLVRFVVAWEGEDWRGMARATQRSQIWLHKWRLHWMRPWPCITAQDPCQVRVPNDFMRFMMSACISDEQGSPSSLLHFLSSHL